MTLDLQEVARSMAAGNPPPVKATGWSVDTRTQNAGDLYAAWHGPNHGHDSVASADARSAVDVVVERAMERLLA